jgi:hypothetical protein
VPGFLLGFGQTQILWEKQVELLEFYITAGIQELFYGYLEGEHFVEGWHKEIVLCENVSIVVFNYSGRERK